MKKRILIVDDNIENLKVLSKILSDKGYDIRVATDGVQAINSINLEVPDLILLDINMPKMDGYETCRRIKSVKEFKDLPIIFISAMTEILDKITAFNSGGADYIQKPFEVDEVLARVQVHIELKHAKDQLKHMNSTLEKKVSLRTKELENSNEELKIAHNELSVLDTAKTEFLQLLSHELRTPLNGILGFTNILKELVSDDELKEFIDGIELSSKRLEKLSYDALLITELNAHSQDIFISEFNVFELFQIILIDFNKSILEKDIEIIFEPFDKSFSLASDESLLKESFTRIIENAIQFSNNQSNITISLVKTDNSVELSIKDEGQGFPEKMLNNKLSTFTPGNTHIDQNIGVDLYLTNLIITALNGKMLFGNNTNKGAYVKFIFPFVDE